MARDLVVDVPLVLMLAGSSFLLTAVLTFVLLRFARRITPIAIPNERSLHSTPTPSGAGICIGFSILACGVYLAVGFQAKALWVMGVGAMLVAAVSLLDDLYSLSPIQRLMVHVLAAFVLVGSGLMPHSLVYPGGTLQMSSIFAAAFCSLFLVWMTNLYNFMDGMDGFAGGMTLIGFAAFSVLGWEAGDRVFCAVNGVIAGAGAGFLVFNFPPARIFMGDVGSSTLGFLAGGSSLWAQSEQLFPLWIAVLVFSPFIVDASVTVFVRLLRGERVWQAHRSHCYQRLVQLGWGHKTTVLAEYALMVCCAVLAILAMFWTPSQQWFLLSFTVVAYTSIIVSIYRLPPRGQGKEGL